MSAGTPAASRRTGFAETAAGGARQARAALSGLPLPVLLYFLAIAVPVHFYAGPLYMTTVRLLLLALVLPLLVNLLRGRYGPVTATDILFLLVPGWMTVALLQNNPETAASQLGSVGVEFLGGYLLGRAFIRSEDSFRAMVRCLMILVTLSLPFALAETLSGNPVILQAIRSLPGLTSEPVVSIYQRWGLERVQVMLAHPIHYGLFCSTAFALVLIGFEDVFSGPRRLASAAIAMACVFFSLSSGALLSMVMQVALILWALALDRVRRRWLVLLALAAVCYVVIDLLSNRTPIRVFMSYATFSAHNAYWRGLIFEWGMKNVWANPVFGLGFNDWVRPWYMYSGSMDNFWLLITVRYGIPAFLLLAGGYLLALFRIGLRPLPEKTGIWRLRRAWMITFVGLTFTLCTVHVWTTVFSYVFFLFGAGMWFLTADPGAGKAAAGDAAEGAERVSRYRREQPRFSRSRGAEEAAGRPPPPQTARPVPEYTRGPEPEPEPAAEAAAPQRLRRSRAYSRFSGPKRKGPPR